MTNFEQPLQPLIYLSKIVVQHYKIRKHNYNQTWPYVIVLYKYFTLTDKAMYLLQGRVSIKPINVTTK